MGEEDLDRRVAAVRRFNRFYTRQIGLLQEGYLDSPFSLTQVRVLYEIANDEGTTASRLARNLGLDPGYLSRILRGFTSLGLVERTPSKTDRRQSTLSLTARGREAFALLDQRSHDDIAALLSRLSPAKQERVVEAMQTIETLLGGQPKSGVPYLLRPPRPGDMGWVVQRHGAVYAQEYGWDESFEALVAEIVAAFVRNFDPKRERCWIAEMDGKNVGCVFCVKQSELVGQLRLLLVEPEARGMGIGRRLVDECVRFARSVGYRKMVLWTNDVLVSARRIYEAVGFRLVEESPHHSFGRDLVGQTWEMEL
ncbi:MAG TPA: bifunctional helix-turn-helix transcriptional regulator/GNAT family N-acetyltransferase [Chloroflexota bacterium]